MSEQLNYNINVTGNASESVGSLKKQLREAQNEVAALSDKFGATSKEAIEAAKRAAELRDRIGDARALTEAFNPDAKFKALSASLSGVAGGFAAVQGAIGLFGTESKELEKQLLRVQSALALSQGLQSIGESIDSFKQLGAVIQSTTVFTKANALANSVTAATMKALGIAVDTTSTSFKVLKGAIAATGIGLLIVAIGELASAFSSYTTKAERAKEAQDKLNQSIKSGAEVALQAELQFIENERQLEIARAKNRGASEKEIFELEQSFRKIRGEAQVRYWNEIKDIDAEGANKARAEVEKINTEGAVADLNFQTEQNNKRREKQQEQNQKNKEQREEDLKNLNTYFKEASNLFLNEKQKEINEIEDKYNKQIALAKKYNQDITLLEEARFIELQKVRDKYINRRLDDEPLIAIETKRQEAIKNTDAIVQGSLEKNLQAVGARVNAETDAAILKAKLDDDAAKVVEDREQAKRDAYAMTADALGVLGEVVGQQTAAGKVLSSAQALINTFLGITQIWANKSVIPEPFGTIQKVAATTTAAASGFLAVRNINKVQVPKGGGGVSVPSFSAAPLTPSSASLLTTSLSQQTINAIGNQAIRAYVVETDITSNQKRVQAIKQRARFS
jgi:hypothetical protein